VTTKFQQAGIRVSLFVGTEAEMIEGAAKIGADRVELYTEPYATDFPADREKAIRPFVLAAKVAEQCGLGLNAGHDLSLENLRYFDQHIPNLLEVSIGHALIADALYLGLEETIRRYKECLIKI
jgi:pyridoxine 5-phosphate synthase